MEVKSAEFIKSSTDYTQCPAVHQPEYAFIGRSNVGKSSLINKLTNRKSLAKTSQNPGKTQTINHFLINDRWHLVDLPGYGYAKASKTERKKWGKMINDYILKREVLLGIFVLIDARHEPQKIDLEFLEWLGEERVPFTMVFTKSDKLSSNKLPQAIASYRKAILRTWEEMPTHFVTSSVSGLGCDEILKFIRDVNKTFQH
ncbi:ribosome biogenesis GTP-binding protein YihA/YsxC [Microscilla marina]|uniref:Probable GTP-binding protein EngB n=1 Tax=Microscilla marina ATCC 23134 TaxID=313606 RepID=A1ZMY0_MICM2|nr:ribosome biogenesis GTP-binding protein YihA/YsxC [Microscilla marina]EAY28161.1 GTP-binding protein [Microscilla marina ATCC 23134]